VEISLFVNPKATSLRTSFSLALKSSLPFLSIYSSFAVPTTFSSFSKITFSLSPGSMPSLKQEIRDSSAGASVIRIREGKRSTKATAADV
jgi:hypothetical protein